MSKTTLRARTIRLASENKNLRPHLLRVLRSCDEMACDMMSDDEMFEDDLMAGRKWGPPNGVQKPVDDSDPYNIHPDSPPAGENRSTQRKKYNEWFRKNVCPGHKTTCGLPGGGK